MRMVDVVDAGHQLDSLVDAAQGGEVIVITRDGKPAVKLVPLTYGERTEWSAEMQRFMGNGEYEPNAFELDRGDVLPVPERDLF